MLIMEYRAENRINSNVGKQLVAKLLFLSRIDQYIDGAHKKGHRQAEMSLQILRAMEQKNTDLLQNFLIADAGAT